MRQNYTAGLLFSVIVFIFHLCLSLIALREVYSLGNCGFRRGSYMVKVRTRFFFRHLIAANEGFFFGNLTEIFVEMVFLFIFFPFLKKYFLCYIFQHHAFILKLFMFVLPMNLLNSCFIEGLTWRVRKSFYQ